MNNLTWQDALIALTFFLVLLLFLDAVNAVKLG